MTEKHKVITNDKALQKGEGPTTAADEALLKVAKTGEGCIPLDMEMLKKLAESANKKHLSFQDQTKELMTPELAALIRKIRVDEGYTWRAVASYIHDHLSSGQEELWEPPSNQIMGMALCEYAAAHFGKDYMEGDWN